MLAGSTALTLVGRAGSPVAVVRGAVPQLAPPRPGPVVVGVDGVTAGAAALDLAAELAAAFGARLVTAHAWTQVVADASGAREAPTAVVGHRSVAAATSRLGPTAGVGWSSPPARSSSLDQPDAACPRWAVHPECPTGG